MGGSRVRIFDVTSFRARTRVYRARKQIPNVRTVLNLTKLRLNLLTKPRDMIKDISKDFFVYSDINCNLRLFVNKKHLNYYY